jgi:hypothetical protein
MMRYALRLQNAVSIAVANILHSADTFFRWEYGWMLALETKKLAHSDRLLLLLSKTIPAPSPTTLVAELTKQVDCCSTQYRCCCRMCLERSNSLSPLAKAMA